MADVFEPELDGGEGQPGFNRSERPVRWPVISEMNAPEVSIYPDIAKVLAGTRAPGAPAAEADVLAAFRLADWEGEQPQEPPE